MESFGDEKMFQLEQKEKDNTVEAGPKARGSSKVVTWVIVVIHPTTLIATFFLLPSDVH